MTKSKNQIDNYLDHSLFHKYIINLSALKVVWNFLSLLTNIQKLIVADSFDLRKSALRNFDLNLLRCHECMSNIDTNAVEVNIKPGIDFDHKIR